jgi:eukaryotic-like serine/threonine-protein kinase
MTKDAKRGGGDATVEFSTANQEPAQGGAGKDKITIDFGHAASDTGKDTEHPENLAQTLVSDPVTSPHTSGSSYRTKAIAATDETLAADFSTSVNSSDRHHTSREKLGKEIGDYRILGELGRGGMGVVFLAQHIKLGRKVAIKMITESMVTDSKIIERFEAEARAVASLKHENVVQLYEIGTFQGKPFFALEYAAGGTLSDKIREFPLSPKDAAKAVQSLASAMHVAHESGVLHRDLKPSNVLLTEEGTPKISDFGLAKLLVDDDQSQTRTGTVMGTPCFMSPEQAQGQTNGLTGATDQYSLGAILYACISGRPPFMAASTIDTLSEVIHKEPVPLSRLSETIPIDLETICLKCLEKEPAKRYASCAELADDLRRFINDEPILARPVSLFEKGWRWCKRNPKVALPSGLAAGLIAVTAAVSTWAWITTSAQAAVITQERDEADRQRTIAIQQKATAEENEVLAKKQAELALQNMQFVVSEVDKKLKDLPGSSDIRIEILEAISRKWDDLEVELVGGVAGEAIPTLMAARHSLAITFQSLDKLEQAQREFEKLLKKARDRVALKGRTDSARTNLVKILIASATLSRRLDHDPLSGIKKLEEAFELMQEVVDNPSPQEGSPSKQEILQLHSASAMNLGVEYLRDGRIAETERFFSAALESNNEVMRMIRKEPGFDQLSEDERDTKTASLQMQLDKSRLGLGYIRLRLGQTERALPLYEKAIASRREIFERRPKMLVMTTELAGQLNLYGKSLLWLNRYDDAAEKLRESVKLYDQARNADPEKVDIKRALSEALYRFATARSLQGHDAEATSFAERSRLLQAELFAASPDEKNQLNLMLSEARMGNVAEAMKHIDAIEKISNNNSEAHLERARALAQLSQSVNEEQRPALVEKALDSLERSVNEGFKDPFRLQAEIELRSLGQLDRFKEILSKIQ